MYGDSFYIPVTAGSTATSAAGAHLLFGSYQGLSTLGNNEVVNVVIATVTADIRWWDSTVSNNTGIRLTTAASSYDLPPMRVGTASQLHVSRDAGTNATVSWAVLRRLSGNL